MTTIIPVRSAQKFLSVLPHICGFVPRRSLVVVPIADGRSAGLARLDLPPGPGAWSEVAATALGLVCRMRDVERFAAVVYSDEPFRDDDRLRLAGFVDHLLDRARHCGLEVVDALLVAADGWGDYRRSDDDPRPLDEIAFEGAVPESAAIPVHRDQGAGAELPPADLVEKERVGRALRDVREAIAVLGDEDGAPVPRGGATPRALATACLVARLPELFEAVVDADADDPDDHVAALLVHLLNLPRYRDLALSQWSADEGEGRAMLAFNERWAAGDRSEPRGPLRLMGEGPRPDLDRLERALALVRRLAALAPRDDRVGPLASAAWLSWAMGRATHAAHYVTGIAAIDPDHGLAGIVSSMVDAGYLPPWAFADDDG